ncbi:MAG: PilZ domain-containing protein [Polyangiales bacterium]
MAARQFGAKREARRAVRRLVDLECEVHSEVWGEAIPHRVTDVSEDGLWIQTDLLLEIGTHVTLTFYPPDWDEPLYVAGRVQRVELQRKPGDSSAVGMGIEFEALRMDERRRLTRSMRGLRAHEAYILDQQTLIGVPVGVDEGYRPPPVAGQTVTGWAAPVSAPKYEGPPTRTLKKVPKESLDEERSQSAFPGGLDLAASVFADRA